MQPECLNTQNHVEEMFLFCSHCNALVELLSCALCTWRRSTHAISWADFPPKHKPAVSSLFLSRPPSSSLLFPSNIFNLGCSAFQFLSDTSYSFSLVEKSGEFACFGRSWPKAPSHSELVFSLLIHQHWLSWVLIGVEQTAIINENLHWHIFSRRRGFCSLGAFWCSDYIQLMNPIHYTKVRPVPCPCCCYCCVMFITIFSCLLQNANPEF